MTPQGRPGRAGARAGPAGPCGPTGPAGSWPGAKSERSSDRVRDLRRVDGVVPDLRVRDRAVLQLRRARRCSSRADVDGRDARPAERDEQRQARDHHRRRGPAQELSHVVPLSRGLPAARLPPVPADSAEAQGSLTFPVQQTSTDSKYSPARRPVRRLTWRSSRSTSRRPLRSQDLRVEIAAVVDDDDHRRIRRERVATAREDSEIPATYSSTARRLVPRAAAPSSRSRRSSRPRSSYA